ncbi:helix-turn-helix domain-containing protein [Streptomyces rimosus]|uniref:helix-turn-helix domain-containing protein n=1 Tax=Streptomyces rimosus TaxID=1927 RepID=UPI0004C290A8|nr:helix-turn-helix transcriptional regulator [Streptomyces rimosus]
MPQRPKKLDPTASPKAKFGAVLRHWRKEVNNLSCAELGKLVHVSDDTIRCIEVGIRKCPEKLAPKLDEALGTDGVFERWWPEVFGDADNKRRDADKHPKRSPDGGVFPGRSRMLDLHASTSAPAGSAESVHRRNFLAAASVAAFMPGIPSLTLTEATPLPTKVEPRDIEQIRDAATVISGWDNTYGGGGMVREAATAQLRWAAGLLHLTGTKEPLRAELFAAVSRLGLVVGASDFDSYHHDDSQAAFIFAARCAEEAKEWHLRAKTYSFLARQQIWIGNPDEGLTYAELGLARSDRLTATEQAMLQTARARAFAKLGQVQQTLSAVGAADDAFANSNPSEDPTWMRYYDFAQHNGDTGHALYDLALAGHDAARAGDRFLTAVREHTDAYVRSRAMSRTKLASLLMAKGDPRQAVVIGHQALNEVGRLRSRRAADDLRELGAAAAKHPKIGDVADLRERIAATVQA